MSIFKKSLIILLVFSMLFTLSACSDNEQHQGQIFAMNTFMTVTAYGKNGAVGVSVAEGVINSLDKMLDPQLSTSTVYAINHANGQPVSVSTQVARMLSTAKEVYDLSGGALDLSVYPLVKLWGFEDERYYVPSDEEIAATLNKLCFSQLSLTSFVNTGTYSVTLPAGGEISFGSVGKGCAAEYAIEAMKNAGIESGIVSLGGNVQTLGVKPNGDLWTVAIADPDNVKNNGFVGIIDVGEAAVVTSGNYERFFTGDDGSHYCHIIKPSTGKPISNSLKSVTIVCDDGILADCLSTAMFVLGPTQALNYWRTNGGFEMILINNENKVTCTAGLIENFALTNDNYTLEFTE